MVFEDLDPKNQQAKNKSGQQHLQDSQSSLRHSDLIIAAPLDRLAAMVVDVAVVIMPVLLLFNAPFQRQMTEAFLLDNQFAVIANAAAALMMSVFLITCYQTFATWLWGGTIGKLFLGLRVKTIWSNKRPTFGVALLRSLVWQGQALLMFVPFASVLSNDNRRSFHDRLSETVVVSVRQKHSHNPSWFESTVGRSIYAAVLSVVFLVGVSYLKQTFESLRTQAHMLDLLEETGAVCAAIGDAQEEWSTEDSEPDRLRVAMGLFAAGEVDSKCLQSEVEYQFQAGHETALAYLASSFVMAHRPELSNAYLEKTCEVTPESQACLMSQVVDQWSEENWPKVSELFASVAEHSGSVDEYINIWKVRHSINQGRYDQALSSVDELSMKKSLASFLGSNRAKAFWGMKKFSEAKVAAVSAYDSMNEGDRVDLAAWLCLEEVEKSCSSSPSSNCKFLEESIEESKGRLESVEIALAHMRVKECSGGFEQVNFDKLKASVMDEELASFFVSVSELQSQVRSGNVTKQATETLKEISLSEDSDQTLRFQAMRLLIQHHPDENVVNEVADYWSRQAMGIEWENLGVQLLNHYLQAKVYKQALEVGQKLATRQWVSEVAQKGVVLAAYKLGEKAKAWEMYQAFNGSRNKESTARTPASPDEFTQVKKSLEKEFGGI